MVKVGVRDCISGPHYSHALMQLVSHVVKGEGPQKQASCGHAAAPPPTGAVFSGCITVGVLSSSWLSRRADRLPGHPEPPA